jgi:hypothetical protein
VNHAPSHMETPAQQPEDDEDSKNRPKHRPALTFSNLMCESQLLRTELSVEAGT